MNKQETAKIITVLAGNYESIAKKTKTEKETMILLWHECLKDLNYNLVVEAVKRNAMENPYQPTIADIRQNVVAISDPVEYKPLEDWNECYKMISRGSYMTQEEFDTYSTSCKRFVGSLQQLRNYAMTECDVINTVVKSNFLKQYEIIKKQEKEQKLLPEKMKNRIQELQANSVKMIGG
jgi:hypothetical protein